MLQFDASVWRKTMSKVRKPRCLLKQLIVLFFCYKSLLQRENPFLETISKLKLHFVKNECSMYIENGLNYYLIDDKQKYSIKKKSLQRAGHTVLIKFFFFYIKTFKVPLNTIPRYLCISRGSIPRGWVTLI